MPDVAIVILTILIAAFVGVAVVGGLLWHRKTGKLRSQLESARRPVQPRTVDFRELDGLPAVVQRYFRATLVDGQPMVAAVRVRHTGTFNVGDKDDQWKPFTSDQTVVTQRPGFDWHGRIAMLPGLSVRVHDAYIAGSGLLHASLFGLVTLAHLQGTQDMAEGELMRFLAEATWYPTALLPSQGVCWECVDDRSALATLTEGCLSVKLLFTFDPEGFVDTVRAEARSRMVGGETVLTPWLGRFWNYGARGQMRVPLDGEVAWLLPQGAKPYWRGRITQITYEFAD